jgi:polyvinyl alcohol dehydrogenase (cytochrome)
VGSWGEEIAAAAPDFICCTFRGSLVALDRASGRVIWRRYTIPIAAAEQYTNSAGRPHLGPSGASIWSSPTYDSARNSVYVGTGDNFSDPPDDNSDAIFAIDVASGDIRWKRQVTHGDAYNDGCGFGHHEVTCPKQPGADLDFTASPVLMRQPQGHDSLLVGQKSGDIYSLDPDTGAIRWHRRMSQDANPWSGGLWFGMVLQSGRLIAPAVSFPLITSPAAGGHATDELFLSSPVNGLYALDARTGEPLWSVPAGKDCKSARCASVMMAPVGIPGAVLAGSADGRIMAVDDLTGRQLWEYDTTRTFRSVNAVRAHGGSLVGAGVVAVANGMVYVISSNVLLAFSVAG